MKESDLPGFIKKRLKELGRNNSWLVAESGMPRSQLYAYLGEKGGHRLKWPMLEKLFAILGLSISIEISPKSGKPLTRKPPTPPDMPL